MPLTDPVKALTTLAKRDTYKTQLKSDAKLKVDAPKPFVVVKDWVFADKSKGTVVLLSPSTSVINAVKEKAPGKKLTLQGNYLNAPEEGAPKITPVNPKQARPLQSAFGLAETGLRPWVVVPKGEEEKGEGLEVEADGEDSSVETGDLPKGMARKLAFEQEKFAQRSPVPPPVNPQMQRKLEHEQQQFLSRQHGTVQTPKLPPLPQVPPKPSQPPPKVPPLDLSGLKNTPSPTPPNSPTTPRPPPNTPTTPRPLSTQPIPQHPERVPLAPQVPKEGIKAQKPNVPPLPKKVAPPIPEAPKRVPGLAKLNVDLGQVDLKKSGKVLGSGAFGTVVEITANNGKTKLAVKTFKSSDKEAKKEMEHEAKTYEKVGLHPNIATCYGVQEMGGESGLVMEKLEGGRATDAFARIKQLRDNGQLSDQEYWASVQHMMGGMIRGLAALEEAGVLHNDLKPDNVMIDLETMEPKLVDFGKSAKVGQDAEIGSPAYTAPEVLKGVAFSENPKASSEQDMFSAGNVLHEQTEGGRFAYGQDPKANMYQLLGGAERFLEKDEEGKSKQVLKVGKGEKHQASTDYVDFLNRLMHPDPKQRLKPSDALKHPFLQQSLLEGGMDKNALLGKLKPGNVPPEPKKPTGKPEDIEKNIRSGDKEWKQFEDYAKRPELRGIVNTAEIIRLRQTALNFAKQPGKLADAERLVTEWADALDRALKVYATAEERLAPPPVPYAKRTQNGQSVTDVKKVGQKFTESFTNVGKMVTKAEVNKIITDAKADNSDLKTVTDAMLELAAALPKLDKGTITLEEAFAPVVKVRVAAGDYLKSHKSALTKDGKARIQSAQAMLTKATEIESKIHGASQLVFNEAQRLEKLKDEDLAPAAILELEGLAKHPLVTASAKEMVAEAAKRLRARLGKLHAARLQNAKFNGDKANVLLDIGGTKPPSSKGQSDSFFINGEDGRPAFLLKPVDGESRFSDKWPDSGGAPREVLLSRINDDFKDTLGLDFRVPRTSPVTLEDPSFANGTLSKETKRTGALQEAVKIKPGDPADAKGFLPWKLEPDELKKRMVSINEDDVQAVAVLDFITLNGDRHAENMLLENPGDTPGQTRLVPIDAGQAFPSREAFRAGSQSMVSRKGWDPDNPEFEDGDNMIMQLPVALGKFKGPALTAIQKLDPDETARKMREQRDALAKECPEMAGKISDESIEISRRSQMLLKAAAAELSIRDIGSLYSMGFLDIIDAEDPDKAIQEAIAKLKEYNQDGGDQFLISKGISPSAPPLSLRERHELIRKVAKASPEDATRARVELYVARLKKFGPKLVSDSDPSVKQQFLQITTQPLPPKMDNDLIVAIENYMVWENYGGDDHVRVLLAGNDHVIREELMREMNTKCGVAHKDMERLFRFGGYARLKKLLGPVEYAKIEKGLLVDHVRLLEDLAAKA